MSLTVIAYDTGRENLRIRHLFFMDSIVLKACLNKLAHGIRASSMLRVVFR